MNPRSLPFRLPHPPWGGPLGVLVFTLISLISGEGNSNVDPSEYRHRGDLHLLRGSSVFSLAWVIEIDDGCSINNVIGKFRERQFPRGWNQTVNSAQFRTDNSKAYLSTSSDNSINGKEEKPHPQNVVFCSKDIPAHLVLLKRIEIFENLYVVGHPYFRIFSQEKRKWIQRKKRSTLSYIQSRNALKRNLDSHQNMINSESIFLKVESCLEQYLNNHPCVKYAKQEILRTRPKRRRLSFVDPLFEEQWHLVSGILHFLLILKNNFS